MVGIAETVCASSFVQVICFIIAWHLLDEDGPWIQGVSRTICITKSVRPRVQAASRISTDARVIIQGKKTNAFGSSLIAMAAQRVRSNSAFL